MSINSELVTDWLLWWSIPSPGPDARADLVTRIDARLRELEVELDEVQDQLAYIDSVCWWDGHRVTVKKLMEVMGELRIRAEHAEQRVRELIEERNTLRTPENFDMAMAADTIRELRADLAEAEQRVASETQRADANARWAEANADLTKDALKRVAGLEAALKTIAEAHPSHTTAWMRDTAHYALTPPPVHCEHSTQEHEQMGWTCPKLAKDTPPPVARCNNPAHWDEPHPCPMCKPPVAQFTTPVLPDDVIRNLPRADEPPVAPSKATNIPHNADGTPYYYHDQDETDIAPGTRGK